MEEQEANKAENIEKAGDHPQEITSMEELLEQEEFFYERPQRGTIRTGVIISVRPDEILVDIGAKREGVVSQKDMERIGPEELASMSVGEEVPVYIVRTENTEGEIVVSLYLARIEQNWQKAKESLENNALFEEKVVDYNKGGLVVPFGDIMGFVPASQLNDFPQRLSPEQKMARLGKYVGQSLPLRVIEVDKRRRRLIMSERIAREEWLEAQKAQLLSDLKEGDTRKGTVTSLADFGAFVNLGGIDGLIHVSELSWHRIKHPREVVKVGVEIEVYVLKVDHEKQRIGLSLRRIQPDPWTLVGDNYSVGQVVEGFITNVVNFGAFACIENGVEGLIHISELAEEAIEHPSEVVSYGDRLLLEIVKIDPERQRVGLSLKRVPQEKQTAWRAEQGLPPVSVKKKAQAPAEKPRAPEQREETVPAPPEPEEEKVPQTDEPVDETADEPVDEEPAPDSADSESALS